VGSAQYAMEMVHLTRCTSRLECRTVKLMNVDDCRAACIMTTNGGHCRSSNLFANANAWTGSKTSYLRQLTSNLAHCTSWANVVLTYPALLLFTVLLAADAGH
jgi:hypothetical protein